MATCRYCAHYDLDAFRISNGSVRIYKGKLARCLFDMERLARKYPASLSERDRPTRLSYMAPDDGDRCPQWMKRG